MDRVICTGQWKLAHTINLSYRYIQGLIVFTRGGLKFTSNTFIPKNLPSRKPQSEAEASYLNLLFIKEEDDKL